MHNLNTSYQINNFWATRNLDNNKVIHERLALNESNQNNEITIPKNKKGYNSDYIKNVMNGLDRFKD